MPIGYSAILLPQLTDTNTTEIPIDVETGSWIGKFFHDTHLKLETLLTLLYILAASVHSLATPFGSLLSGPLADYLGRRRTLIISVIPLLFGWSTLAIARSVKVVIFARFLCGFATGILGGPGQVSDWHTRAQCHWPGVRSHGTHEIPGTNGTVRDCPSDPLTVIGRALNSHTYNLVSPLSNIGHLLVFACTCVTDTKYSVKDKMIRYAIELSSRND